MKEKLEKQGYPEETISMIKERTDTFYQKLENRIVDYLGALKKQELFEQLYVEDSNGESIEVRDHEGLYKKVREVLRNDLKEDFFSDIDEEFEEFVDDIPKLIESGASKHARNNWYVDVGTTTNMTSHEEAPGTLCYQAMGVDTSSECDSEQEINLGPYTIKPKYLVRKPGVDPKTNMSGDENMTETAMSDTVRKIFLSLERGDILQDPSNGKHYTIEKVVDTSEQRLIFVDKQWFDFGEFHDSNYVIFYKGDA